ncbi:MAG: hypothetical protein IT373_24440 [Polyangiaceae bacterium]|nr:hypothetical protein [Polyangiaceae bacterium]
MPTEPFATIQELFSSERPEDLRRGLELARAEIARLAPSETQRLFELMAVLFYIDPLDHPELVPIVDDAVNVIASLGPSIIPALLGSLAAGDVKAQLAVAHALGRMGVHAVEPLVAAFRAAPDPERQAFLLYALGKIRHPEVAKAVPLALLAVQAGNLELRDTATRAIGKLAESIAPDALPETMRVALVEQMFERLADASAGVRSKAVRSLGKLAAHGHLTHAERGKLRAACHRLLGRAERFDWDRAYVVRREAEAVLRQL